MLPWLRGLRCAGFVYSDAVRRLRFFSFLRTLRSFDSHHFYGPARGFALGDKVLGPSGLVVQVLRASRVRLAVS